MDVEKPLDGALDHDVVFGPKRQIFEPLGKKGEPDSIHLCCIKRITK